MIYQFKDATSAMEFYNRIPLARIDNYCVTFPKQYEEVAKKMGGTRVYREPETET